ncbi:hypothetical protein SPRG_12719 [Saprolegnia parasitica CBS 223.65]|uniref:GPI transamidase component PIG-T n=1 Tax=Saprolegnia parasitica (strain CBS 223.65) TaxID=695850 RepID=A0A067BVX7_SAPPC|nr:hypothetical protein SPRG_12719 [Saprolegnia parasitica CBS 223.65]KDO22438.1 hypothetical protein SPRG_12719 [Saprolegnia parasitica CBS 223.65]|eukprot:XP_012206826.1 hypothetical protein SPRG_12719 [Saprolegnia parasitica CBS 223.65]
MGLVVALWTAALALAALCAQAERTYSEDLTLRPLHGLGKVAAHFSFLHEVDGDTAPSAQHFDVFPKHIRQVLHKFNVSEFELTFANGMWRHEQWGDAWDAAPFGALLSADVASRDDFHGLAQALAGIFSASLTKMDGVAVHTHGARFFESNLPREELCTENLSPWLKLLPCRSHAGLGAFVHPLHVLDSDYVSMRLRVSRQATKLSMHQTLTFVKRVDDGWSLASALGATTASVCLLATESLITTELASEKPAFVTMPAVAIDRHRNIYKHILPLAGLRSVHEPWLATPPPPAPKSFWHSASVHRYLTGFGQVRGGVAMRVLNKDPKAPLQIAYNETIPSFMRVYFSSLRVAINGKRLDGNASSVVMTPATTLGALTHLRVVLTLPPQSRLELAYAFEKSFLPIESHPPDASRGFDAPAASVHVTRGRHATILYTEPLLVQLPVPDFSMPYNVICLTSTVVSMAMGSFVNTLLRHERKRSNLGKLVHGLKRLVKRLVRQKEKTD